MNIEIKLKEIKDISFITNYYNVEVVGIMKDKYKSNKDDFDSLVKDWSSPSIFAKEYKWKSPRFDFHLWARKHSKSTLVIEFDKTAYESWETSDRVTLLLIEGKVFELPCAMEHLDLESLLGTHE